MPPLPKPRSISEADLRDGSPARAIIFAAAAGIAVATVWFFVSVTTGSQISILAWLAGLFIGGAVQAGADKATWPFVALAGVVTIVAMVVADYLIARHFLAKISGENIGAWIGFSTWKATISPENLLFWVLGLTAAMWIAATKRR